MKYRWDKKYLYWGMTAFLVICLSICFYYFLFHGVKIHDSISRVTQISMPIIFGFIIAYLLTPILNFLERNLIYRFISHYKIKRTRKIEKRIRFISIILVLVLVIFIIYSLFAMIIPQLINSLQSISSQFPSYINNLITWFYDLSENNPMVAGYLAENNISIESSEIINWFNHNIMPNIQNLGNLATRLYTGVFNVMKSLFQFLIGIIISIYLMGSKELFSGQAKKVVYALLEEKTANQFIQDMRFVHKTFIGFLSGKIVDSIIIGILCFIGTTALDIPYAILVSVIIGVTNIIPFFGPYLGAIPCAVLILMISPLHCLYFVLFILVLQQIDGNIIGPKILGDSTGLSSFWVIFAITFAGGLFGIPGMVIGVPVFAVIYAGFRALFHRMLQKKGLSTNTNDYIPLAEMKEKEIIPIETISLTDSGKKWWKKKSDSPEGKNEKK